jgi:hypothetical protein
MIFMSDAVNPLPTQRDAVLTLGGVLHDLVGLAARLAVTPERAEASAAMLDQLSAELGEAAAMLRTMGGPQ